MGVLKDSPYEWVGLGGKARAGGGEGDQQEEQEQALRHSHGALYTLGLLSKLIYHTMLI